MRDFKKIYCWELGMEIIMLVYKSLEKLPSSEKYGLREQQQRHCPIF